MKSSERPTLKIIKTRVTERLDKQTINQVCKDGKLDKRKKSTWEALLSLSLW